MAPGAPLEFELEAAFRTHGDELFGFARRALGDAGLAEEALQETFLRAWRARDRFDADLGNIRAWLFAIERRIIIDLGRARFRRESRDLQDRGAEMVDSGDIDGAMVGWIMEDAIRQLRPEHRHVLVEVYFHGKACNEVAAEASLPEGTVRSRLFYALRSLRLIVEEKGIEI